MAPRFSIWMVVAGVVVGVLAGYVAGSGVIGKRPALAGPPQKSGPLRAGRRAETVAAIQNADREVLREALAGRDLEAMSFEEILARLEELFQDATARGVSSADMLEAGHKLHVLIGALPQEHVVPLLDALLEHPVLKPTMYAGAVGIMEGLLERLVAHDISEAVKWAKEAGYEAIEIVAGIVGQTDPEGALALLKREGRGLNALHQVALFKHLVARGPSELQRRRDACRTRRTGAITCWPCCVRRTKVVGPTCSTPRVKSRRRGTK